MKNNKHGNARDPRAGFSLMEIAIAIVVLAVGVLSVFGLMGGGLNNSEKAVADSYIAMFADSVLNGLRAESVRASEQGQFDIFWNAPFTTLQAGPAWGYSDKNVPEIEETGNDAKTLIFTNMSFRVTNISPENIVNHALRYKLNVEQYRRTIGTTRVYSYGATLKVWDGQFGQTADKDAYVFYSEFSNLGTL